MMAITRDSPPAWRESASPPASCLWPPRPSATTTDSSTGKFGANEGGLHLIDLLRDRPFRLDGAHGLRVLPGPTPPDDQLDRLLVPHADWDELWVHHRLPREHLTSQPAAALSPSHSVRAADVTKERRPLVLLVRETPLHVGHLRLMTQAAECGAIIMVPAFYHRPRTLDELIEQNLGRALDQVRLDTDLVTRWNGPGVSAAASEAPPQRVRGPPGRAARGSRSSAAGPRWARAAENESRSRRWRRAQGQRGPLGCRPRTPPAPHTSRRRVGSGR